MKRSLLAKMHKLSSIEVICGNPRDNNQSKIAT